MNYTRLRSHLVLTNLQFLKHNKIIRVLYLVFNIFWKFKCQTSYEYCLELVPCIYNISPMLTLRLLIVLIYILQGLHVEKPTNEPVPVGNSLPTFKGKMKPEKYPANYKTCINFVQPLLKMLHNMIKRPGGWKESFTFFLYFFKRNVSKHCYMKI